MKMNIDVHNHFYPKSYLDELSKGGRYARVEKDVHGRLLIHYEGDYNIVVGPHIDIGPDIIVGYNWGYRSSWENPLGGFPRELIVDNDQEWSGDHAMDYRVVPGVLITNRKITMDEPALYDLTVAVLDEYGVAKSAEMIGRDCLGPLQVEVESEVPVGRGLGSSAALIVAVAAAARVAAGMETERPGLFAVAAEVEGHPDNVAAAVFGGALAVGAGGTVHPLEVHPSLRVLVAVPAATLPTAEARRVLEDPVDTAAAARTAARLAFLIEGLRTGSPALLGEAGGDELHEARRAHLAPRSGDLMREARAAGALHAAWSGAGPAVIALTTADLLSEVRAAMEAGVGEDGVVLTPVIDRDGVTFG